VRLVAVNDRHLDSRFAGGLEGQGQPGAQPGLDVRALALTLPRSSEGYVRGRLKFRVGRIVYLSFSRDGSTMGFAFPKEWRDALVESDPDKFSLPSDADLRYHWVHVRMAAINADEMRDLVEDAWAFVVPKRVAEEYAASRGY